MSNPDFLNDVRFLRDVVERTQPPSINPYWPVTLSWGCVLTAGYVASVFLGIIGKADVLAWLWPALIFAVAMPLGWYLGRKVRLRIEERGIRPRGRKDLTICWFGIATIGLLWTAGLGISGMMASHWYVLLFVWGSLHFIGYVMNGVLLSSEWLWAAAILLVALMAAFLAGPDFYWLAGVWIGGTQVLAGLLGRRNARLHPLAA
jgi:hypothetical protein